MLLKISKDRYHKMSNLSEIFDFVVRIGYGKALWQFLNAIDASNLSKVDTQCKEIYPIYTKRWGFKPVILENNDGSVIVAYNNEIHRSDFPYFYANFNTYKDKYMMTIRGKHREVLTIFIEDINIWNQLEKVSKKFEDNWWLRKIRI